LKTKVQLPASQWRQLVECWHVGLTAPTAVSYNHWLHGKPHLIKMQNWTQLRMASPGGGKPLTHYSNTLRRLLATAVVAASRQMGRSSMHKGRVLGELRFLIGSGSMPQALRLTSVQLVFCNSSPKRPELRPVNTHDNNNTAASPHKTPPRKWCYSYGQSHNAAVRAAALLLPDEFQLAQSSSIQEIK
jgi:hypothetical protein